LQVPFGIVDIDDNQIRGMCEETVTRHFVNTGIYVLRPKAIARALSRRN
jgi:NDP-sugar pyrophosphorylase family protein